MEQKVDGILAAILDVEDRGAITPTARLDEDLGADSLDAVDLVMELEREFSIVISDRDMDAMTRWQVSQVYDLVGRMLALKAL